jgi:hypothetical protein
MYQEFLNAVKNAGAPGLAHLAGEAVLHGCKKESLARRRNSSEASPSLFLELWEISPGRYIAQESGEGSIEWSECSEDGANVLRQFYNIRNGQGV